MNTENSTDRIKIAMWAGPRNISTTIMRSFENRVDATVVDEPFYACYLAKSGAQHPMRDDILKAQSSDWDFVINSFDDPTPAGARLFFEKHIAFHYGPERSLDWLFSHRVFLLIRNPVEMVASYSQKFDDVAPIKDSLVVQKRIYDMLTERDQPCPIIDSKDVLLNPEGQMRALCVDLAIPFDERMLSWPVGRRDTDGVWGAHWYDAVEKSTGFNDYSKKEINLPEDLQAIAEDCAPLYEFFHKRRIAA